MPQLTFPIVSDGLVVDVLVNLDVVDLLPIRSSGQSRPPVQAKGVLDTASNVTGVSLAILQQLGVLSAGQTSTTGIGGPLPINLYRVSLHIRDASAPNLPMFTHPSVLVMDLAPSLQCEVLIGRDILMGCKTIIDGPAQEFTLVF